LCLTCRVCCCLKSQSCADRPHLPQTDLLAPKKAGKVPEIYTRLLVEIDEVVSEDVVGGIPLNSTGTGRMMLKSFPADSAQMLSEIHAYEALQSLQGSAVP
jgi:hypothetical protein